MFIEILQSFYEGFRNPRKSRNHCNRHDKSMRKSLSEEQIDKMLSETFPASDPITMY